MSYMTKLERDGKMVIAMNALNSLRHRLEGRQEGSLNDIDKSLLREALELSAESVISKRAVVYSFRGFSNRSEAAALQLSDVIRDALERVSNCNDEMKNKVRDSLSKFVDESYPIDTDDPFLKHATDTIYIAMDIIRSDSNEHSTSRLQPKAW